MRLSKRAKVLLISTATALSIGVAPAHAVDLQGSGRGIANADANIGDFWFSDNAHTGSTRRDSVIHAPVVAAPIVVMHSLPRSNQLYLSPVTVAKIFSGEISRWNDPAIVADNNRTVTEVVYKKDKQGNVLKDKNGENVILRTQNKNIRFTLPDQPIRVFYRSDNSGTTSNFTRWLNAVAPTVWNKPANQAFTTAFPGNLNASGISGRIVGANGSQGVALNASQTKYAITYAESNFASTFRLKSASIGNAAGNFTLPTSTAVSAFLAESKADSKSGFFTFDYATKEPGAYTLGIVSYMLIDTEPKDKARGRAVKEWAEYLMSEQCVLKDADNKGFILLSGKLKDIAQGQLNKFKL